MVRDPIGQTIAARLESLEAPDDRTLVWRLRKPFASLPYALAKTQPSPVIMPARIAATDPYKQVQQIMGSGPFRWVADEYVPGSRAVFARFDRYHPCDEPVRHAASGHRVLVDRVEWSIIPDAATAANALIGCVAKFAGVHGWLRRAPDQAATWNSSAMKRAWARMSLPPTLRTCPFLTIAIAS